MKFLTLLFVAVFSATILTGCERQLVSPVDPTHPSQTTTIFAQKVLSDLADTAAKRAFVDLANAASGVAETLAIDDGTSVEPLFSKIAKLAAAVTILEHAFNEAACEIELQKFAEATTYAVKAYTIRDAADMEQALRHLAQEALNAEAVLQQLPAENPLIPFAFGYGLAIENRLHKINYPDPDDPLYEPGVILIQYNDTIRSVDETRVDVVELLAFKGYTVQAAGNSRDDAPIYLPFQEDTVSVQVIPDDIESIDLGVNVDPLLIIGELMDIPGVALAQPNVFSIILDLPVPIFPPICEIMDLAITKYNEAWCQGNFDVIDAILIERTGLNFFDYAFLRNLEAIYAEEFNGTNEGIGIDGFSRRAIGISFLDFYRYDLDLDLKTPLDKVVELYGQSIKSKQTYRYMCGYSNIYDHYYLTTDYWKQLVTDHLNK